MGTKAKVKSRPNETEDDETLKKQKKKKRILLFRLVRKRKRLSQSQEFLHDTRAQNFKIELEIDEQEEKENDVVDMEVADSIEHHGLPKEDDIVSESRSYGDHDVADGVDETTDKGRGADEKKRLFKFFRISFSLKKRRKKTEYSKFTESTDNILGDLQQNELNQHEDSVERDNMKQSKNMKKMNSKRYVRFETDNDDDKENMAMTIDEEDNEINNQMTPKKKKKSTKKRIAKASRKTGRVFRDGMIQIGHNLQYLSPMPTAHVFAEPTTKKKASYTDTPKKRNYKYTAKAPPTNPYGFI